MHDPLSRLLQRHGVTDPEAFLMAHETIDCQRRRARFDRWYRRVTAQLRWL